MSNLLSVFSYGGYQHPAAEINFAGGISRNIVYSKTQRRNIFQEIWNLKGRIVKQGPTAQADILTALDATRTVYSVNNQSAGFAGTPFWMDTSKAIGGVIVRNHLSHGSIKEAEGTTFLEYTVSLQMDSFLSNLQDLLEYQESVTFTDCGGNPRQIWREPAVGLPIVQFVSTNTYFEAIQNGSATSRDPGIQAEEMLWPESLLGEPSARRVTPVSAIMERGVPTAYSISWSYRFRQIVPFNGGPHNRG